MLVFRQEECRDLSADEPGIYLFDDDSANAWIKSKDTDYVMSIPKIIGEDIIRLSELVDSLAVEDEDKTNDVREVTFPEDFYTDGNGNQIKRTIGIPIEPNSKGLAVADLTALKASGFTTQDIIDMANAGLV